MRAHWASVMPTTMMSVDMFFDPTLFILRNQDLFMTVGVVVAIGTLTLVTTVVTVMLALRSAR